MQIIKNGALAFTGFKFKGTGFGANAGTRKLMPQWTDLEEDHCGALVWVFPTVVPESVLKDLEASGHPTSSLEVVTLQVVK